LPSPDKVITLLVVPSLLRDGDTMLSGLTVVLVSKASAGRTMTVTWLHKFETWPAKQGRILSTTTSEIRLDLSCRSVGIEELVLRGNKVVGVFEEESASS
jgi:hypothetical protein